MTFSIFQTSEISKFGSQRRANLHRDLEFETVTNKFLQIWLTSTKKLGKKKVSTPRCQISQMCNPPKFKIEVKLFFCLVFIIKLTGLKQIIDRVAQETDLGADLLLVSRCKFCNATHYLATQLDSTSEHPIQSNQL